MYGISVLLFAMHLTMYSEVEFILLNALPCMCMLNVVNYVLKGAI